MSDLLRLSDISMRPVVEFEPAVFGNPARCSNMSRTNWTDESLDQYWHDCLADAGLSHLNSITYRSWFVDITKIDTSAAEILLKRQMAQRDEKTIHNDNCLALTGGLALFAKELNPPITPECCGDLGDQENWVAATRHRSSDWLNLWIGHPWIDAKYDAGRILLSEQHESNECVAKWSIDCDELARAVEIAVQSLESFANTLRCALDNIPCEVDKNRISRVLAGLDKF